MEILLLLSTICILASCQDLRVGEISSKGSYIHDERIEFYAIPYIKRSQEIFYCNAYHWKIKGIEVLEKVPTRATVAITAGGIGFEYVNLRFTSQRSYGLYYDIKIY